MFLIGDVSEQARKLVEVTRECMMLGIEQVKPGHTVGDIGYAIQRHAEAHHYSVVRAFVGHGTGVYFHEPPDIPHYGSPRTGTVLVENMVFTIEPMINIGGFNVHILEDGWTVDHPGPFTLGTVGTYRPCDPGRRGNPDVVTPVRFALCEFLWAILRYPNIKDRDVI